MSCVYDTLLEKKKKDSNIKKSSECVPVLFFVAGHQTYDSLMDSAVR